MCCYRFWYSHSKFWVFALSFFRTESPKHSEFQFCFSSKNTPGIFSHFNYCNNEFIVIIWIEFLFYNEIKWDELRENFDKNNNKNCNYILVEYLFCALFNAPKPNLTSVIFKRKHFKSWYLSLESRKIILILNEFKTIYRWFWLSVIER